MSEIKHTPGPWYVSSYEDGWTCIRDRLNAIIAKMVLNNEANAYLMAAATDLLEALEALERQSGLPLEYNDPARIKARTAIAKAKGE